MGRCIQHVACPECRKKGKDKKGNNLGIYDDSSTYCFACGFSTGSNIFHRSICTQTVSKKISLRLPNDLYFPPLRAYTWLSKFNITDVLIKQYQIQWSESKKALVFPVYDNNKLIFYQLKRFEKTEKKWQSFGTKPLIFLGKEQPVVLVEDYISAIRVSESATAVPLYGSTIDTKKLLTIREKYDHIIIWLDYDKATDKQTKKLIETSKILFKKASQIITEKDPKAYSSEEIRYQIDSI